MQFIELLETGTPNIDFSGHSENTFRIINFLCLHGLWQVYVNHFMQWVKNDVGEIFIRQFESFVSRFFGNGHTSCIFESPARIIWLLKVMETFTNATILSIHSTKLETLINRNSKR